MEEDQAPATWTWKPLFIAESPRWVRVLQWCRGGTLAETTVLTPLTFRRYHTLYLEAKGNRFKNKRVLMEHIHRAKAERVRTKNIQEQMEARRVKNKAMRERKAQRLAEKRQGILEVEQEDEVKE